MCTSHSGGNPPTHGIWAPPICLAAEISINTATHAIKAMACVCRLCWLKKPLYGRTKLGNTNSWCHIEMVGMFDHRATYQRSVYLLDGLFGNGLFGKQSNARPQHHRHQIDFQGVKRTLVYECRLELSPAHHPSIAASGRFNSAIKASRPCFHRQMCSFSTRKSSRLVNTHVCCWG